jgi:excisionase family DNA binding protein
MEDFNFMSTAEAAKRLGVTVRRVQKLCESGRLGIKVGGRYLITATQLDTYSPGPVGRPKSAPTDHRTDN